MESNGSVKSKVLAFLLVVLVSVLAILPGLTLAAGSTVLSGDITSGTTWTLSKSPYLVIGDITVRNGATLTIEPGVTVKFYSPTRLNIGTSSESGTLVAKGTISSPISFTSASDRPAPGNWWGIFFSHLSNEASIIENSVIEYSTNGVMVDNRSLAIRNSKLQNNHNAVWAINTASVTIENNTFSGSGAQSITVREAFATIAKNKIVGTNIDGSTRSTSTITNNEMDSSGIYIDEFSTATIKGNTLTKSKIQLRYSSAEISNNTFLDSSVSSVKGSAYFFTIRANKFTGGEIEAGGQAVIFTGNEISNTRFSGTAATADVSANLIVGAGIEFAHTGYGASIANNMILGGSRGITIRSWSSSPTSIINNTIVGQSESGVYLESPHATIVNNIISSAKYGIFIPARTSPSPVIDFNNVFGTPTPYFNVGRGTSDISVDPLFVGSGDYHLRPDSPCVDAGTPSNAPATDYDGDARPYPPGGKVDIGADEYTPMGVRRSTMIGPAPSTGIGEILGRVLNQTGQPIPGTAVRINNIILPTNPGGEFRFTLVQPGVYTVYYDAPGYVGQTQVIEAKAGVTTRPPTVIMSRLGEIVGQVVNQAKRMIPGTVVRVNNSVMPTNSGGEFRFTLVYPGVYTIYYDAPGYRGQTQVIEVRVAQLTRPPTVIMDSGITPSTQGEIYGRVLNQAHQPVHLAAVRINNVVIPTNTNGEFRFSLVNPGKYTICYDAAGYVGQTQVVSVEAGMLTLPPTVIMSR